MKRRLFTAMMLTSFLSTPLASFANIDANTMPNLNNAIGGNVTQNGTNMTVTTNGGAGAVGQFDWNSFNVGSNGTVHWAFTNNNQTALNRVLGNNMSEIYGKLTSGCAGGGCTSYGGTGKVVLINPNGIMFGEGSSVNINSFTASTFDAVGAKNIKDLSGTELTNYANSLNANFGPNVKINFTGTADKIGALIKLDNSKFDIDKSLVILAKDVEIGNGTTINTNLAYNYGTPTLNQNFSNVKIAAGNGAIVEYQKNGYVNNESDLTKATFGFSANEGLANVNYNVKVGDAGAKSNITSGNIFIKNNGITRGANGSNIVVQNTDLAGVKLVNSQLGEVSIVGNNTVDVKNSTITTYNTFETANPNTNTYGKQGGTVLINGEMGVDVDNVLIQTANSNAGTANAGDVVIKSRAGNVSVNKSNINSQGNVDINAGVNANITNSLVYASNTRGLDAKSINIKGANEVNIGNSSVAATGNTTISSDKNINIYKGANGQSSTVYAGEKLSLHGGAETTVTDTGLSYKQISLFENGKVNNVTIQDATTLEDRSGNTLALNSNGDLTIKNNQMLKRNITFDITQTTDTNPGSSILNVNPSLMEQSANLTAARDVNIISDTSLNLKNVNANAGRNNNITAKNDVTMNNVKVNAQKTNITATNGSIKTTGTELDGSNTKIVMNAGNDIDVKVKNVQNRNAGIEANGKNVKIDATDNILSVSRIVANNLTLDANDKFIAAQTTLSATDKDGVTDSADGRAYIQVNNPGGFNLDNAPYSVDANGNYQGIYTADYKQVGTDANGNAINSKHFINLDGTNGAEKFLLVYDKTALTPCTPEPEVPTDPSTPGSVDNGRLYSDNDALVRIPLQNQQVGSANINNNLTDMSGSIIAAAAGITIEDDEEEQQ